MLYLRMKCTKRGTENGFTTDLFEAGECYWVADTLACSFLNDGYAELVENPPAKPEHMQLQRAYVRNVAFSIPQSSLVKRMKGTSVCARF